MKCQLCFLLFQIKMSNSIGSLPSFHFLSHCLMTLPIPLTLKFPFAEGPVWMPQNISTKDRMGWYRRVFVWAEMGVAGHS